MWHSISRDFYGWQGKIGVIQILVCLWCLWDGRQVNELQFFHFKKLLLWPLQWINLPHLKRVFHCMFDFVPCKFVWQMNQRVLCLIGKFSVLVMIWNLLGGSHMPTVISSLLPSLFVYTCTLLDYKIIYSWYVCLLSMTKFMCFKILKYGDI